MCLPGGGGVGTVKEDTMTNEKLNTMHRFYILK